MKKRLMCAAAALTLTAMAACGVEQTEVTAADPTPTAAAETPYMLPEISPATEGDVYVAVNQTSPSFTQAIVTSADIRLTPDFADQLDRELGLSLRGTENQNIRVSQTAKRLFAGRALAAGTIFPPTNKSGGRHSRQRLFSGPSGPMQQIGSPKRPAPRRSRPSQDTNRMRIAGKTVKAGHRFHQIFSNRSTSVTMIVAPPTVTSTGRAV